MPSYSIRRLYWSGPVAISAAVLADLLFYAITKTFGENYLLPLDGTLTNLYPMPVLMLIFSILIPGILATIFWGLLLRYSKKPVTVFLSVAITALILSLGGPLYLPPIVALQTKLLLAGMETIAAVIITGGLLLMNHQKTKIP